MDAELRFKYDTFPCSVVSVDEVSDVSSSMEPIDVSPSFNGLVELDVESGITHLLKAYGEAMEMEMAELAEEIMVRLGEKGGPITGSIIQRLAYYISQALNPQPDFSLKEATSTNYEIAFNAFYQILPFGRFAHFASNCVIMEALQYNKGIVLHIIDFDFDKGVQWPPIIEELASQPKRVLKLTTITWEEQQKVDKTCYHKNLLCEYAKNLGVKVEIDETGLDNLSTKMKKHGRNEWLAFNCMVGLPHMGRRTSVSKVVEFLKIAKDSIASNRNQGTITFGDGIGLGKGIKVWIRYRSIFEVQLCQVQAFLESMETQFPQRMKEARITIESLFLPPYICSLVDPKMWEEISMESGELSNLGLKSWRMRDENLLEAKELVKERESNYWVEIEGLNHNQMVLGYKSTPLVKVSSWR